MRMGLILDAFDGPGAHINAPGVGAIEFILGDESQGRQELFPSASLISSGLSVGEIRWRSSPHPHGFAGAAAEMVLKLSSNCTPSNLRATIQTLVAYAKDKGLSAVVARPATVDAAEALQAIGFEALSDNIFLLELVSSFWRKQSGVYVIAEAGSNWRMGSPPRDFAMAKALIDVAAEAGADAVKFQTFRAESVYVAEAGSSDYLAEAGITQSIQDIFADIAMPYDMLPKLAEYARQRGIDFMSTAFSAEDFEAVDPLVAIHKIASYEISHIRLIELAARSGKPTVMSTGAATLEDIAWAVDHYHTSGGRDLCLLQCTAKYPAPLDGLNLASIPELARMFGVPAGLSDHSRDPIIAPLAATALGARVIEKHFTLDNRLPGPDHMFAVTALELAAMISAIRAANVARGTGVKEVHSSEIELAAFAQRGVQAIRQIDVGDTFKENENVAILRPGKQKKGVHPRFLAAIAGARSTRNLRAGEGILVGDWSAA